MSAVADQVALAGSYSSAEVSANPSLPWRPRNEHPAIEEPHRGMALARRDHRPGGIQTPPGPATGVDASVGAGEVRTVGAGDSLAGVATAASEGSGSGGTSDGRRTRPEPAATTPPPTSRAAAARRVRPRPRLN